MIILQTTVSTSWAQEFTTDDLATTRDCFPIVRSVQHYLSSGRTLGFPVFIEETSVCRAWSAGQPRTGQQSLVAVPSSLSGYEALVWIVEGTAQRSATTPYSIAAQGNGWRVSGRTAPSVLTHRVDLDPRTCTTVTEAERCIFTQAKRDTGVWVGANGYADVRDVLPNSLTLVDLPVVDALCELYAPHERVDTGFALLLQPVSTPDRPTGWEGPLILLADRPTGEDGEAHFRTP